MEEHISFDEMQKLIFADSLSPEIVDLGGRVSAHVLSCEACADLYKAMLNMREINESIARERVQIKTDTKSVLDASSMQKGRDLVELQMTGGSTESSPDTKLSHAAIGGAKQEHRRK